MTAKPACTCLSRACRAARGYFRAAQPTTRLPLPDLGMGSGGVRGETGRWSGVTKLGSSCHGPAGTACRPQFRVTLAVSRAPKHGDGRGGGRSLQRTAAAAEVVFARARRWRRGTSVLLRARRRRGEAFSPAFFPWRRRREQFSPAHGSPAHGGGRARGWPIPSSSPKRGAGRREVLNGGEDADPDTPWERAFGCRRTQACHCDPGRGRGFRHPGPASSAPATAADGPEGGGRTAQSGGPWSTLQAPGTARTLPARLGPIGPLPGRPQPPQW